MAAMHDDGEVGFEEGMLWLPSHVLDEACGTKVISFFFFSSFGVRNSTTFAQLSCFLILDFIYSL